MIQLSSKVLLSLLCFKDNMLWGWLFTIWFNSSMPELKWPTASFISIWKYPQPGNPDKLKLKLKSNPISSCYFTTTFPGRSSLIYWTIPSSQNKLLTTHFIKWKTTFPKCKESIIITWISTKAWVIKVLI